MDRFREKTALRIALVSFVVAVCSGAGALFWGVEKSEEVILSLASEEGSRLMKDFRLNSNGTINSDEASKAVRILTGGFFDIAEIYDVQGKKYAESLTEKGEQVEHSLPAHSAPLSPSPTYERIKVEDGTVAIRVFVPLKIASNQVGYMEGVRIIQQWQKDLIWEEGLRSAFMAILASVLCGLVIYPVVVHLSSENERKTKEVLDSHISMMESLGRAIAKRDSDTGVHNYRVAWLSAEIAERLGIRGKEIQSLIAGSFLHDVGKIGIPDAILLKPGKLDDDEMSIMRTHVQMGDHIVSGMGWLDAAKDVVSGHHEKWDGSGYPMGISGEKIPLSARIFAIVDVFDALSSHRPYKEPFPFEKVLFILQEGRGTHFDPRILDVFMKFAKKVHEMLYTMSEDDVRNLLEEKVRRHFAD